MAKDKQIKDTTATQAEAYRNALESRLLDGGVPIAEARAIAKRKTDKKFGSAQAEKGGEAK